MDVLSNRYGDILATEQKKLLDAARKRIGDEVQKKTAEAAEWLEKIELRVKEQDKLTDVLTQLSNPPPFLAQDKAGRIPELRAEIQRKLEENDALHIRELFLRIKDRTLRLELLEELRRMLDD